MTPSPHGDPAAVRLIAVEDFPGVDADQTVIFSFAASITDQATGPGEEAILGDHGHRMTERQCADLFASRIEEIIGANDERVGSRLPPGCKDRIQVAIGARVQDIELHSEDRSRRLQAARKLLGKNRAGWIDEYGNPGRRRYQFAH